ncbi:hypothetical protein [Streptomyces sp. NPDC054940]
MFVGLFPVVVTALPADEDHAPLSVELAAARITRAERVAPDGVPRPHDQNALFAA